MTSITKKTMLFLLSLTVAGGNIFAQEPATHDFTEGQLSVKVETMAFFRNNEYSSELNKGYTLPGAWIRPALNYNPTADIHFEVGASGLFYSGANKYPCYAYHDIAKWKGNQYQDGAHVLPWLRAEMKTGHFDIVLGDIYGGTEHGLSTPLYNKELMLSADPEFGAQILYTKPRFNLDVFCNWQSFQFNNDTHQEAFTVGVVSKMEPFKGGTLKDVKLKADILAQHRGGELDKTDDGVQTIYNASVNVAWDKHLPVGMLNHIRTEAELLACYQQTGKLWPFDSGMAYHASVSATFMNHLHAQVGYFHAPEDFVSLYGNAFFSTISLKNPDVSYTGLRTTYLDFGYSRTFAKGYTFGANFEAFHTNPSHGSGELSFTFGLYMHLNPEFILGK